VQKSHPPNLIFSKENGGFEFEIKTAVEPLAYIRPQYIDCRNCGFLFTAGQFLLLLLRYPTSGQLGPKLDNEYA